MRGFQGETPLDPPLQIIIMTVQIPTVDTGSSMDTDTRWQIRSQVVSVRWQGAISSGMFRSWLAVIFSFLTDVLARCDLDLGTNRCYIAS